MNLSEYYRRAYHELAMQLIELLAVCYVRAVQQWAHNLFSALHIRLWRTGPVCFCTP